MGTTHCNVVKPGQGEDELDSTTVILLMDLLKLVQLLAVLAVGCLGYNINYDYSDQELAEFIARTKWPLIVEETKINGDECHCRVESPTTTTTTTTTTSSTTTSTTTTTYTSSAGGFTTTAAGG